LPNLWTSTRVTVPRAFRVTTNFGVLPYVERNPLSAGLVDRAQPWRWGILCSRTRGTAAIKALLTPWPVERPANCAARVYAPLTTNELDRVRVSIERGRTYGEEMGAGNGKRFGVGADRSSGRPPTESEPVGDRGDKLITRISSTAQIHRQINRVRVSPRSSSVMPLSSTWRRSGARA